MSAGGDSRGGVEDAMVRKRIERKEVVAPSTRWQWRKEIPWEQSSWRDHVLGPPSQGDRNSQQQRLPQFTGGNEAGEPCRIA